MSTTSPQSSSRPSLDAVRADILAHLPPRAVEAYQRLLGWLIAAGVAESALQTGDVAPDFVLPDASGQLVSSRALREKGPLVISFFRGGWCPFCTAELCALQAAKPDLNAAGATLVAITPDTGGFPRELAREQGLDLQLLSDVDYGVGLAFGIIFAIPEIVRRFYKDIEVDLPRRHGNPDWMLPIPATYVIDQDGVICDAYVEPDFTLRQEPAVIIERLNAMAAAGRRERPGAPPKA